MAEETPAIPETTPEVPMETSALKDTLLNKIDQGNEIVSKNEQQPEPMVQPVINTESVPNTEATLQKTVEVTKEVQEETNVTPPEQTTIEKPTDPEPPKVEAPVVKKISVFVKTPTEKESFEIEENAGVKDFKQLIAPKFNAEPDQLVLIFAGKIMDDSDTMQQHKVKNGLIIHLVIRIPETGPPRQSADISATPYGLGNLGGLVGLAQLGMGSPNFMELQNQMQNELLTNPNVLRNLLDNPLVQELMTHTDVMRSLIMRNPQMQELIDR